MTFFRAFLSVSALTTASRILGLVRDIVIAAVFGASAATDAFFTAFRLPNMLRRFSAEGAMTQAFVPVYAAAHRRDPAAARQVAGDMFVALTLILVVIVAAGVLFAESVIGVLAPGLAEPQLAADLFRIVFPYVLFISLVALCGGMLNTHHFYRAAAFAPLLLNIALITATLWWVDAFAQKIFALAWGVLVGGAVQLAWMAWHLTRAGIGCRWRLPFGVASELGRILRLVGVGLLGSGAAQINLLINLFIASFLAAGSISWLYYADRLMELPVGIIGATLGIIALPALSQQADDDARFKQILATGLRLLVVFAAPAAVGLAVLALPLVSALFLRGAFSTIDALQTQIAVLAYSIGVVGLVAVRLLAAAFFARQDFRSPVCCALLALAVTQVLNGIFILGLGLGHAGLALAVGLGACANAAALLAVLLWRRWVDFVPGCWRYGLQVAAAVVAMAAVLEALQPPDSFWLYTYANEWERAGWLVGLVVAGAAAYFAVLWVLGVRPSHFYLRLAEK